MVFLEWILGENLSKQQGTSILSQEVQVTHPFSVGDSVWINDRETADGKTWTQSEGYHRFIVVSVEHYVEDPVKPIDTRVSIKLHPENLYDENKTFELLRKFYQWKTGLESVS